MIGVRWLVGFVLEWFEEWIEYPIARVGCRWFGQHTLFCRGRWDHVAPDGTLIGTPSATSRRYPWSRVKE